MISDDPYLEQQYNNRAAVADYAEYLASWASRSEVYRSQVEAYLDMSYGPTQRQQLDIFPASLKGAAVHVFIHGGYWQALNKDSFSFMAKAFNQQGECGVILNYDLCPDVSLAEIIQQIQQGIVWIQQNIDRYGGDPQRMQVTGHSAGGHLLAELLATDWSQFGIITSPFKRLNSLSGLFDCQPLIHTSVNKALQLDEQTALSCSPLFKSPWNADKDIQLNVLVGELESDEYKKQSKQLYEKWGGLLTMEYRELDDTHHFSILDRFLADFYRPL